MSRNREIEAKTLISAKVYQNLKAAYPAHQEFWQENYYFDTPGQFLHQHSTGLRIRLFQDHAEQTMKVPDLSPVQHRFHEVIEINDPLPLSQAKAFVQQAQRQKALSFSGSVGQYLRQHFQQQQGQLRLFTWSKTKRILATGPQNCELTLDQTSYPDGYQDYELEIENSKPPLIKEIQAQLEKKYHFQQNKSNTNQNKSMRASKHRR